MSSMVSVHCTKGFVISTDSIVFKHPADSSGKALGKIKGSTRKLFQLHDDVLAVGLGNWNAYFPMFTAVAGTELSRDSVVKELHGRGVELTDTKIYVFRRNGDEMISDIIENGQVRTDTKGAIMYPEELLNALFLVMYESDQAKAIRATGMLGIAALVNAYNAFALSLCSDISGPFDTVLFLRNGVFAFTGGVTRLPVGDFM